MSDTDIKTVITNPTIFIFASEELTNLKLGSDGQDRVKRRIQDDIEKLKELFGEIFGRTIPMPNGNCSKAELLGSLNEYVASNPTTDDALIVCILGPTDLKDDKTLVYMKDDNLSLDEVISKFRGHRCTSLYDKPKLYFVQTFSAERKAVAQSEAREVREQRPVDADIHIAYCNIPYTSGRPTMVQGLCEQLTENRASDLSKLLTSVNRELKSQPSDDRPFFCEMGTPTSLIYLGSPDNNPLNR